MPNRFDYDQHDFQAIKAVLATLGHDRLAVPELAGPGWLGFFEDNEAFAPKATGNPARPTVFAQWALEYDGPPRLTLDPDASVYRAGTVAIYLRTEQQQFRGRLLSLAAEIRRAFAGASRGDDVAFFVEAPLERQAVQDGWWTELLAIPFKGV